MGGSFPAAEFDSRKDVVILCGFVGMFDRSGSRDAEQMMTGMSAAIRHRGPDDSQYLRRDGFHIAFRRLSIIDLAGMFGFEKRPYFEAQEGAEKAPEVKF